MDNNIIPELIKHNISITTMECCTSGLVASYITDNEGSSAIFKGGLVTYSDEAKIMMGVNPTTIEKFGVYSAECARDMAQTALQKFNAQIAIGVTGTTGNVDPNNSDSVVGELFYCICTHQDSFVYKTKYDTKGKSRKEIKEEYVRNIFSSLYTLYNEKLKSLFVLV